MNKEIYADGDRVQFTIDGDISQLRLGTVRGLVSSNIINLWIVVTASPIEDWPYSAIAVQDSFMRRDGEDRPFGCENAS